MFLAVATFGVFGMQATALIGVVWLRQSASSHHFQYSGRHSCRGGDDYYVAEQTPRSRGGSSGGR